MIYKRLGLIMSLSLILTIIPCAGVLAGPPDVPNSPTPADASSAVSNFADLQWTAGQPQPGDNYTYTVYFGSTNPPPLVAENITSTFYDPGTLAASTTYYWQIIAWSQLNGSTAGPLWTFSTVVNQPPFTPRLIKVPLHAGVGFSLNFTAVSADPEGDNIFFEWQWGDGRATNWIGPYFYGDYAVCANAWNYKGTYSVRVRARDASGATSSWCNPIIVSVAPQIELNCLKPGFMYFNLWGFDKGFGFTPVLEQYGMSVIFSTMAGAYVNATVSPAVVRTDFVMEDVISHDAVLVSDSNMSDGSDAYFDLNNGFYKTTAYAYDVNGNLIDKHTRDLTLFLLVNLKIKERIKNLLTPFNRRGG